ncbi:hypothetical protein [Aeromonas sp. 5HA1]|uniref:hypothetical protein n=1 Tax=Aeromonas sp. 5HA1 TaxID=2699197 RepID=UPI0023DDE6D1|nr:hypothetical protein [Aeromonas sp. 5HA1]
MQNKVVINNQPSTFNRTFLRAIVTGSGQRSPIASNSWVASQNKALINNQPSTYSAANDTQGEKIIKQ